MPLCSGDVFITLQVHKARIFEDLMLIIKGFEQSGNLARTQEVLHLTSITNTKVKWSKWVAGDQNNLLI